MMGLSGGDDHVHKGMRRKLVSLLREKGITAEAVLEAISRVPRHLFIDDSAFQRMAYEDIPFPIGHDQTISQPYTVARQSELLDVRQGMKVLEVGTGCGYQTAVLCAMGAKVYSIERIKALHVRSRTRLEQLGHRPQLTYGDGFAGLPGYAPFDRILVTCGAPTVPQALVDQLKPGGRLVIPLGAGEEQTMLVIDRDNKGHCVRSEHGTFRFVPMLTDKQS